MQLNAASLATATATVFFLIAACGGGTSNDPSQPPPNTNGGGNTSTGSGGSGSNGSSSTTSGSGSSGGTASNCQPQTVVGGDLSVVAQGPVGVTLISTGGLSQYTLTFLYNNVFGVSTNNQQDKWGSTTLFPPGTPVGTSTSVQLQPYPFVNGEQTPTTFPKGIPVELWLTTNDGNQPGPSNSSSTASIGKDIPHDFWHTASVTYNGNNTATVTFFSTGGPTFAVGLTNVTGQGAQPGC